MASGSVVAGPACSNSAYCCSGSCAAKPPATMPVLAGNCGRLTGGIQLMPEAVIDDGELNVVAITAKGIYGMAGAATHILARKPESHAQLDRWTARRLEVGVEEPQKVEIDGDVIGETSSALIEIEPRSLIVRVSTAVPATPSPTA